MSSAPVAPAAPATAPTRSGGPRGTTLTLLNALALGVVIALVPGAMIGQVCQALLPHAPWLKMVVQATTVATSCMGLVVGFVVGSAFKFTPLQSAALGMGVQYAAGAVTFTALNGAPAMLLKGSGDIITMGLAAALGVWLLRLLGNNLKAWSIIVIPPVVTVVVGVLGRLVLPWSLRITAWIGAGVKELTTLAPLLMGMAIAVAFAVLICTPITTVGIALAIGLAGIGSGAGNVGICACAFGFAILGWRTNGVGTSVAHFVGSPKMSMANFLAKPKIMLPNICSAAVSGLVSVLLGIKGTPMSAGFGISGFVGPLGYFGIEGWGPMVLLKALVAFVLVPVGCGLVFATLFKKIGLVKDEDYHLDLG